MFTREDQAEQMAHGKGFIAALDQSGGSTPKALERYGVAADAWSNETEMFDLIHEMRTRIMTSPAFTGERIIAAILFEQTMDREVEGRPTPTYLSEVKHVVPILKVDKGLAEAADGVRLMKPIGGLDELCARAVELGVFGTKMRSVIESASEAGIAAIVAQQFDLGGQIAHHGLVPILEPEIDIKAPDKAECEKILKSDLLAGLEKLPDGCQVMFKLTLPEVDDFYSELIEHPRVMRVVALSGGYSRDEANERLARNHGLIASFSRALTEGLSIEQDAEQFNQMLDASIQSIYDASIT